MGAWRRGHTLAHHQQDDAQVGVDFGEQVRARFEAHDVEDGVPVEQPTPQLEADWG